MTVNFLLRNIYTLSEKASNQLNAISRIQTFISFKETLITVHLYDIFCSAESLNKIEKMHEKALRKLYNDFCDYEAILNKSAKSTMKVKHLTNLALGIFRTSREYQQKLLSHLADLSLRVKFDLLRAKF